jgi:hypothetical protein
MTRLFNDPADFASEALDKFVHAHSRWFVALLAVLSVPPSALPGTLRWWWVGPPAITRPLAGWSDLAWPTGPLSATCSSAGSPTTRMPWPQ